MSSGHRGRCDNRRLRILHVIHDFLPRHRAGSEIYALDLCRELSARHAVTVLCAEYDPARRHGDVHWRAVDGLPVAEIVNNWICRSFTDTYRPPLITDRIRQVLRAVQPHVVHVHSLLNLSFDLPAIARASGVPVVAAPHDYSLVCPSGGQRLHRAEAHSCDVIDTERCVRCFRQSPFFAQLTFAAIAKVTHRPGWFGRTAIGIARRVPRLAARLMRTVQQAPIIALARADIDQRIAEARTIFNDIDVVVAPSPSLAREFERLGFDRARIRTSDYGFVPLTRLARPAPHRPLRLGFVGTLVWHKGVHVLLEALQSLPGEDYSLSIYGDMVAFPDYVASLRALAAGMPVTFKGTFGRADTAAIYAALDVLVVPSIWMENSPLVIHEAFMAGVPVVAARVGGICDLVDDGVNGRVYDMRSANELREILRDLINHPDQIVALAARVPAVKPIAADAAEWETVYEAARSRLAPDSPT
jgi:glycosyltransferase involved in cell wall biosynthesis